MMNMEDEGDQESMQTTHRKKKDKNTRRFTDEQISSLESMFKLETKLEPRKKLQLARELGLQPRQVAIWFQNRRARWKSKQIEQDYTLLKSNYDNLSSRFDSLNKENKSLLNQLQKLRGKFKNQDRSMIAEGNFSTDESESGEKTRELKEDLNICSDDDNIEFKNKRYLDANGDEDGGEFSKLSEQADVSLVPTDERWCNLESGGMLNWWDYST